MATIQKVLYELIGVDRASPAFDKAGASAGRMESRISKLGKGVALAGGAIAAGAVAIGYESVKAATAFQASMEKIHTQAGATQRDVKQLSGEVLKLGATAQQGPKELADSLYHLKSVGLDNAKAMLALRAASNLAAVGGASLEETTNAIAGAWRSGIKGAGNFGQAAATVNAIIGAGNMRMEDFIGAIGTGILPAARTFGLSLTSVGSALALLTDEGIPATVAATRLRMSFSLLGAPSAHANDVLSDIGVTGLKLANAMRSPGGLIAAIGILKTHLDASGLSLSKQAQLLSNAFGGGRSSSAILTLLNNYDVLKRKQDQVNHSLGKFGPAVIAQRKTAQAQFALLKSSLDVIGIRIGLALLPPVTTFVRFLASRVVPGAVSAAGTVGRVFNEIIPVKTIEKDWNDVLRIFGLNKPKPIKVGSGDLLHVKSSPVPLPMQFTAPKPNLDTFYGGLTPKQLSASLSKINWTKVGASLGKGLGSAIGSITADTGQLANKLIKALAGLDWETIGKTVGGQAAGFTIGLMSGLGNDLFSVNFWKKHWWDVVLAALTVSGAGKLAGGLSKILEHIPILRVFAPLLARIDGITGPLQRTVGKVLKEAIDFVAPGFRKYVGDLIDKGYIVIGSKVIDYSRAGLRLIKGLGDGAIEGRNYLYGKVRGLAGGTVSLFSGSGRWLLGHGGDLILGFLRGIRARMAGISGWIRGNVVNPVINAVKHFFGIHSPSTVFHGFGVQMIAGLIRGLTTMDGPAVARKVFGSMPKALGSIVGKGLVGLGSLGSKALGALGGLGGDALGLLGKLFGGGGSSGSSVNLGRAMASGMGWTGAQWNALNALWTRESGWNKSAKNASSGAYGIPQALPASKMATAGADWLTNAATQIRWGLGYIKGRYGSPLAAWAHELAVGWYDKGGILAPGQMGKNFSRMPEAILTGTQWADIHTLAMAAIPTVGYQPAVGSGAGSAPCFDVRVFIGNEEITGIVRTEISEHDRTLIRKRRTGAGSR